jgi:hypothetical protein
MKIRIVSGTDTPLLRSDENHRHYAARHGYDYIYDTKSCDDLPDPSFGKLRAAESALAGSDWVFWAEDDAFFTNMSVRLESFLADLPDETFLVACVSPVNPAGGWTYLTSGTFFLRNSQQSRDFIGKVLATPPLATVKAWWNPETYGIFTNGDQDAIVYTLVTEDLLQFAKLYPYDAFNSRPYHYKERLNEHFLVRFPGVRDKAAAVAEFGERFGVDATLIPAGWMKRIGRWVGI